MGCFWHGCPDHYVPPRSTIDFWSKKLAENVARDRRQTLALEAAGWRVVRVWECEVIESLDDSFRFAECNQPGDDNCVIAPTCPLKGAVAEIHRRIRESRFGPHATTAR